MLLRMWSSNKFHNADEKGKWKTMLGNYVAVSNKLLYNNSTLSPVPKKNVLKCPHKDWDQC